MSRNLRGAPNVLYAQELGTIPSRQTLSVVFVLPRPNRLRWKRRPMPCGWHQSKPDADNLLKAVKNSLNGLFWQDDSQIAELRVSKWHASGEERPGVELSVRRLTDTGRRPVVAPWTRWNRPDQAA
jgi:Holliday junction resolvase RusA-like endonuclease